MPHNATHMPMETLNKSFSNTLALNITTNSSQKQKCFSSQNHPDDVRDRSVTKPVSERGCAPIELLPMEIFDQIIPHLAIDTPSNGYAPRNKDLASCLLVSRAFHCATLSTLYANVTFPHSTIFSKFLAHISRYPDLGELVKRLDFSHFTSVGLGRTRRMNYEIQKLTATTLRKCLDLNPNLREFFASEALDDDMDQKVLEKLFCDLPRLNAVDFCAASSAVFVSGFLNAVSPNNPLLPEVMPIKRLGLHGCTTLPPSIFATLLSRLSNLTHLDLTHTQITDGTLHAIPQTARLTHLSLSKCNRLKGPAVVDFLINHPSTQGLIHLNLLYDTGRYRLLTSADVDELLPELPLTLRSLNISGAKINFTHVPQLRRLAKQLEELSIGNADLSVENMNSILQQGDGLEGPGNDTTSRSTLRYLDLTGISSITPSSLIDTTGCSLLTQASYPLRVIEVGEKIIEGLKDRPKSSKRLGWAIKSQHRRSWYIREKSEIPDDDDGSRSWKMGGKWWGGRKVGMGQAEISGIYGYYGFGK
ncbi:uncharacterized protein LAJ45_06557 [Morchella importuna]|uniref:uncharacterized protein n=1 Tax=Morchella importuna TaxID=1174673 RepID=UPI001E8DBC12|nr:uncharacterized protein LAJ45_06557 [Morchella importuna]KAH8149477.1 hypothetical protein LAJ45_06557 [Morchella importuna]